MGKTFDGRGSAAFSQSRAPTVTLDDGPRLPRIATALLLALGSGEAALAQGVTTAPERASVRLPAPVTAIQEGLILPEELLLSPEQRTALRTLGGRFPDARELFFQQLLVQRWIELETNYTGKVPVKDRIHPDRMAEALARCRSLEDQRELLQGAIFVGVHVFPHLKSAELQRFALSRLVVTAEFYRAHAGNHTSVGEFLAENTRPDLPASEREAFVSQLRRVVLPGDFARRVITEVAGDARVGQIDRLGGAHYFPGLSEVDNALVARSAVASWRELELGNYQYVLSELALLDAPKADPLRETTLLVLMQVTLPPDMGPLGENTAAVAERLAEAFPDKKCPDAESLTKEQLFFLSRVSPAILYAYFHPDVSIHRAATDEEIAQVWQRIDFELIREFVLACINSKGDLPDGFEAEWKGALMALAAVGSEREALAMKHALRVLSSAPPEEPRVLALEFGSGHSFGPEDFGRGATPLPLLHLRSFPGGNANLLLGHDTGLGVVEVIRGLAALPKRQLEYVQALVSSSGWLPLVAWCDLQTEEAQLLSLQRVQFIVNQGLSRRIEEDGIGNTLLANARSERVRHKAEELLRREGGISRGAIGRAPQQEIDLAKEFWRTSGIAKVSMEQIMPFLNDAPIDFATPRERSLPELIALMSLTPTGRSVLEKSAALLEQPGTIRVVTHSFPNIPEAPLGWQDLPRVNIHPAGIEYLHRSALADLLPRLVETFAAVAEGAENDSAADTAREAGLAARKRFIAELLSFEPGELEVILREDLGLIK